MHTIRHLAALCAVSTLALGGAAAVTASSASAAPSGYQPHSALINGDSVYPFRFTEPDGTQVSLEQYAAEQAGFTVTVVDGSTWAGMSAADFAKYQVLISGDNVTGSEEMPPSVSGSVGTWAPVVLGTAGGATTAGNRAVAGTDPADHYVGNPGALDLVQDAIAYAGGVDGATGVYLSDTGEDSTTLSSVLNQLSSTGTGFTTNNGPPCGGNVALIADVAEFDSLQDSDIQGWGCSVHVTFPTYASDWQPLAVATDTATQPTCGIDPDTGNTACGESYVLIAGRGIVSTAPDLSVTPTTDSAPAGGSQTVTATVTQSGSPLAGQPVTFTVTGQNAGVSGTCMPASCETDSSGQVSFTYDDVNGAGVDTIIASTTVGSTTEQATSTMTWTTVGGPFVDAGPNASGAVNTPIALDGSSSGTTSTEWSVPAGTPCTFADPAALDTTITCTVAGTYTATLTGTDGTTTVSDTTKVKVTGVTPPGTRTCRGQAVTIMGTKGDDVIDGTRGDDVIFTGRGDDVIDGHGGSDIVCAGAGNDTVRTRSAGDLYVKGGSGDDVVRGGLGDDFVVGGKGDDYVRGGPGDDRLKGGPGNDRLIGNTGMNTLDGNDGTDACGADADGSNTYNSCESIF